MADIYLTVRPRKQTVAHSWKTSILRTAPGEEFRSSLFTWFRLDSKLSWVKSLDAETNWFRRNLSKYKHKIWGIPVWNDLTVLSADAAAAQLEIPCVDTTNRHYYKGRNVILIDKTDHTNYEVAVINSLTANTIGASNLLASTWDKDTTYVCPVYDCRLGSGFGIKRFNSKVDSLDLNVMEDVSVVKAFTYDTPTIAATYLGHPVFEQLLQHNKDFRMMHPNLVREGIGKSAVESWMDDDDTNLMHDFNGLLGTREDVWNVFNFFDNRMGRRGKFWMPSWNRDLYPAAAITAGATLIQVEDYEYDTLFAGNEVINRHLFIGLPDRSYVCRKITAATATTITLDAAIGVPIRTNEFPFLLLSFLNLSRFGGDRIEMDYFKRGGASFRMTTFGLVKETP